MKSKTHVYVVWSNIEGSVFAVAQSWETALQAQALTERHSLVSEAEKIAFFEALRENRAVDFLRNVGGCDG